MNQPEDVEVILGHQKRYKFHAGTLARSSTLFAELLTENNAAKLNKNAKNAGVKVRWIVELTCMPCDEFPGGQLKLATVTPTGERGDKCAALIINENGKFPQADQVFGWYEAILYAIYNKELTIENDDMEVVLKDCFGLVGIAEYLGCSSVISKPIEVALLKHGQNLFRAIQVAPHLWANLACRIRSELVFRECMIHLVGNWKVFKTTPDVMEKIRTIPLLRGLIERHHRALLKRCKDFEVNLLSFYPGNICRPTDDLPIKREVYARDTLVWMGLTFFRHWVSQRLLMDKGRQGMDCGFELYSMIGEGGDAYMDRSVLNQFHTKCPMTKKALTLLERHVFEIKECVKDVLKQHGLLKSECQLDISRFPVNYLTCVEFQRGDLPWKTVDEEVQREGMEYEAGGNEIARRNLDRVRREKEMDGSGDAGGEELEGAGEFDEGDEDFDEDMEDEDMEDEDYEPATKPAKRARVE